MFWQPTSNHWAAAVASHTCAVVVIAAIMRKFCFTVIVPLWVAQADQGGRKALRFVSFYMYKLPLDVAFVLSNMLTPYDN
jgi:hypothetical protein